MTTSGMTSAAPVPRVPAIVSRPSYRPGRGKTALRPSPVRWTRMPEAGGNQTRSTCGSLQMTSVPTITSMRWFEAITPFAVTKTFGSAAPETPANSDAAITMPSTGQRFIAHLLACVDHVETGACQCDLRVEHLELDASAALEALAHDERFLLGLLETSPAGLDALLAGRQHQRGVVDVPGDLLAGESLRLHGAVELRLRRPQCVLAHEAVEDW